MYNLTERKPISIILNPNQRRFLDDERRFKQKMDRLQRDSIESPSGMFTRKIKVGDDPDLLDHHDSFYHTTRSLLVLFQIMGVMPIKRSPSGSHLPRTTFGLSGVLLWAMLVYMLETVVVVMVGKERILSFLHSMDKKFDEIIYNVIFISILVPHFLIPFASWCHGPQVAIFKNMWTHYQLKYLQVTGTPIIFPNLYRLTWALCVVSWLISLLVILPQYYLQPDFTLWHTFAYYHIIAMLNGFCSLWYINCNAFGTASRALAKNLELTLQSKKPAEKLTDYRHLWVDLSHMMQQLGMFAKSN